MTDESICEVGCQRKAPHVVTDYHVYNGLTSEQIAEGRRREFLAIDDEASLPSLGEDTPFTVDAAVLAAEESAADTEDDWETFCREHNIITTAGGPTFEETFADIYTEAFNLLVQRQRRYGDKNIEQQGMWGVLTRIADDKISRLKRSFNGQIVNGSIELNDITERDESESFEDACIDVMNYAAILLALKRGLWGRPLSEDVG